MSRLTRLARTRSAPFLETLEDRLVPATLPPNFSMTLVTAGLSSPTAMDFAPDGRLFVAEQTGALRVIKNGVLQPTPFVSLNVDSNGERGLLGVAFDPNFTVNHFVYVYYTTPIAPVHNRVSRFTANGDVAVPGSEVDLLDLNNLSAFTNHNGGGIHFGPDGKLYIGVGENANPPNSQTLSNLLGKMLRINPDGSIPTDNPFFNVATGVNRAIWAIGLRNPFTFAFQPGTGRLFINDVGQSTWEEINDGIAGSNYGWPITEGPTTDPRFRSPLFAYGHGAGDTLGFAITGGTFYDPPVDQFPSQYVGTYFFQDLTNGWIRDYNPATNTVSPFASGLPSLLVDLKVDSSGTLFVLDHSDSTQGGSGSVYKIQFTPPGPTPFLALYQPINGQWLATGPNGAGGSIFYGKPNDDIPVLADYDGDGRVDLAVYRPSNGTWYIVNSGGGTTIKQFGQPFLDIPVPADYDGDHKADLALYRPTTGEWIILRTSAAPLVLPFGIPHVDQPVPGDYDGDGKVDIAVYRPTNATWYILQSAAGVRIQQVGIPNQDEPVPADYDNDGKVDPATFRPSDALWTIQQSTLGLKQVTLGAPSGASIPVPYDFDNDGKLDLGAFQTLSATWTLLQTTVGPETFPFGNPNLDVPLVVPLAYRFRGTLQQAAVAGRGMIAVASQLDVGPQFVPIAGDAAREPRRHRGTLM